MKKILIVDDSYMLREDLKKMISLIKGLEVAGEASNVIDAVKLAKELRPDIIILDINLPEGSGFDVLSSISVSEKMPAVLMFTNYANRAYQRTSEIYGARYFFDKSKDIEALIDTLKQFAFSKN
jgi:DNA-binding NarL/FixJ family response regulator